MPKRDLSWAADHVLHVVNRGVRRQQLFWEAADYAAFLAILAEGQQRASLRVLAFCVMPNHFHLVLWPRNGREVVDFMWWTQLTHSKRWHRCHGTQGTGAVYQGRYRVAPVRNDSGFLPVCRYVERNPLRANLVSRAEEWPWSSLGQRCRNRNLLELSPWPILQPEDWMALVNAPQTEPELRAIRTAFARRRGRPKKTPGVISGNDSRSLFQVQ